MSNYITCPFCSESIEAPDTIGDYDWCSGVSSYGRLDMNCPRCGKEVELEVVAEIVYVMTLNDPDGKEVEGQ